MRHRLDKSKKQYRVYLWDSKDVATVYTQYYYRNIEDPFRVFGYSRPLNMWQRLCKATTYDYVHDDYYYVHYI